MTKPPATAPQPTLTDSQRTDAGLQIRYHVQKADGSPVDENAFYFVLRIDQNGDDQIWIDCCREAVEHLAEALATREHLPELVVDLMKYLMSTQRPDSPPLKCESSVVEAQAPAPAPAADVAKSFTEFAERFRNGPTENAGYCSIPDDTPLLYAVGASVAETGLTFGDCRKAAALRTQPAPEIVVDEAWPAEDKFLPPRQDGPPKRITEGVVDMLAIIDDPNSTENERSAAASTIVEAVAPDILEDAIRYIAARIDSAPTARTAGTASTGGTDE